MKRPEKISIANLPTPFEKVKFNGCEFFIKRDDYTGIEFSGNKVRKLEYLVKEAMDNGAEYLFTCGGYQSNHCRAVAAAAARFGLRARLFVWGFDQKEKDGNLLLDDMFGASVEYLSEPEYENVYHIMEGEAKLYSDNGSHVYIMPAGGSTTLAVWGYVSFVKELSRQTDLHKFSGVLSAAGSGGTSAGLLAGFASAGLDLKVYAVNVIPQNTNLRDEILRLANEWAAEWNPEIEIDPSNLEVLEGFSQEGYHNISPEKVDVIRDLATQTGILTDPAYTGKAFYAYNTRFLDGRESSDVIFLHTGGVFGIFPKRMEMLGN